MFTKEINDVYMSKSNWRGEGRPLSEGQSRKTSQRKWGQSGTWRRTRRQPRSAGEMDFHSRKWQV